MTDMIKFSDLPLYSSEITKEGMTTIIKELSKYSYEESINIVYSTFLSMITFIYKDKKERNEIMKAFQNVANKTFSEFDKMKEIMDKDEKDF